MNALPQVRTVSAEEIRALLIAEIAVILELQQAEIDPAKGFDEYGLDSVAGVILLNAIEETLGTELEPEVVMAMCRTLSYSSSFSAMSSPSRTNSTG